MPIRTVVGLAFVICIFMVAILSYSNYCYDSISELKKEINVSREREEKLAQAVKQIAYEMDVLSQTYLQKGK